MITPQSRPLLRRQLLACAAANALLLGMPIGAVEATGLDLSAFLKLSETLTEQPHLSQEIATVYLANLINGLSENHQTVNSVSKSDIASPSLAARIVADWYSGLTISRNGAVICVDYAGALLWEALGFATPAGVPNTEEARWALPP